jgi:hypothetical protein
LGLEPQGVVWARRDVATGCCPTAYVTPQSVGLLEEFLVRRQLGGLACEQLDARKVEAFIVLERELEKERRAARG